MARHTGRRIRIDAANQATQDAQQLISQTAETPNAGDDRPLPPRLERMFRLLHCLHARSMFTGRELAAALNVSRRTIYRDISLLRDAGIEVYLDPATAGYSLPRDFDLRPRHLRDDELTLLGLAVRLSLVQAVPELAAATQEALAKLLGNQAQAAQQKVGRLVSNCQLDLAGIAPPTVAAPVVLEICQAMERQRQIRVTLHSSADSAWKQSKIAPYQLVASTGRWHLVGRSSVERRTVQIDLAQIQHTELTDDEFKTPVSFRSHTTAAGTDEQIEQSSDTESS